MENLKKSNLANTTNVVNNKSKVSLQTLKNVALKISDVLQSTENKTSNLLYKFELERSNLTEKQSKAIRVKLRKQRNNLAFLCAQSNKKIISSNTDETKLLAELNLLPIENFAKFYKANFISNDFSFESISNSKMLDKETQQDSADKKNIEFSLSILQLMFELNCERITKIFASK